MNDRQTARYILIFGRMIGHLFSYLCNLCNPWIIVPLRITKENRLDALGINRFDLDCNIALTTHIIK